MIAPIEKHGIYFCPYCNKRIDKEKLNKLNEEFAVLWKCECGNIFTIIRYNFQFEPKGEKDD